MFKLSASYRPSAALTLGALGVWETGTPLSEFGATIYAPAYPGYLYQRGTAGRTPSTWEISLRVAYQRPLGAEKRLRPRLTLDVLHLASQRRPVRYDELHYQALDSSGNQTDPNPNYGNPLAFQPPMAVRLGFETSF